MPISSALCRVQEAYHRSRAAGAELANVRTVATGAARAWELEAIAAENRERRAARARLIAEATKTETAFLCAPDERAVSENPDRGFADNQAILVPHCH